MPISFRTTTEAADKVKADLLAIPVFADAILGPGGDVLERALGDDLATFMEGAGYTGKVGTTLAVPAGGHLGAKAVLLVGLGPVDEVSVATLRRGAAAVARRSAKAATLATTLAAVTIDGVDTADTAQAVAEGAALGSYQFLSYKSEREPTELRTVVLAGVGGARVSAALERASVIVDAVRWARDMVNEPAGHMSPADFAAAARSFLSGKGVTVTVLTEQQLRSQKMGGVIGVGQGSARPPRFVKVTYNPPGGKARGTLALVGKGVVFDSGGLSLKPAGGMETMKIDMGGAAAVLGAMSTLRALGVKERVVAYTPMVENMPGGNAIRPGDVLCMHSGTTVEVLNTDAEGRLILADALSMAVDDQADAIVDLATLTGACVVALGEKVAGVMGNDDGLVEQVTGAAGRAGEAVWPLPLPAEYQKLLESQVADLRNISKGSYGGALTAGLFLEAFVAEVPWVHLDIAGPVLTDSDDGELTKGATGFGVRTLVELVRSFERPAKVAASTKNGARPPKKKAKKSTKRSAGTPRTAKKRATKRTSAKKTTRKRTE